MSQNTFVSVSSSLCPKILFRIRRIDVGGGSRFKFGGEKSKLVSVLKRDIDFYRQHISIDVRIDSFNRCIIQIDLQKSGLALTSFWARCAFI